jgi:DNA-binding PucR family transcriptional regulator
LLYQLKRIREISGLDLDEPRVRLELLMVLNILEP